MLPEHFDHCRHSDDITTILPWSLSEGDIMYRLTALLISSLISLLPAPPAEAQDGGDRLLFYRGATLDVALLPRGPLTTGLAPDGRLFATQNPTQTTPGETPPTILVTIDGQGNSQFIDLLALEETEAPRDLAFTPDGRLYLLVDFYIDTPHPFVTQRLLELSPETAAVLARHEIPPDLYVSAIAPSPRGLWLPGEDILGHFNPSTGAFDDSGVDFDFSWLIVDADTDSTGALWFLAEPGFIDPPFFDLFRFDPATGSRRVANFHNTGQGGIITMDRRCQGSATARCLQGGRFRASVVWRDHQGNSGEGQVAQSSSADSALFWFFDAANWEVLVKVIDGCDNNGNYWVFSAGTTDVEYTLEVTDLATGEVFTSTNPLGQAAAAVTATDAFPACP